MMVWISWLVWLLKVNDVIEGWWFDYYGGVWRFNGGLTWMKVSVEKLMKVEMKMQRYYLEVWFGGLYVW